MRLVEGNSSPALAMAERTRSRASFTSVSARPTSVKLGRPLARWTSTQTGRASRPSSARLCTNDRLIDISSLFRCIQHPVFPGKPADGDAQLWCLRFSSDRSHASQRFHHGTGTAVPPRRAVRARCFRDSPSGGAAPRLARYMLGAVSD